MNAKFELEIADQNIVVSAFRTPGGTAELFERIAQEARLANVEHRKQICSEALKGLTDLGLSVDQGKAVLNAINKGLVPHVSIKF